MNPLLRKEIRVLAPAWVAAMAVATMPLWPVDFLRESSVFFFGAAILALAVAPFGQEISHGTFGLLLVQPVNRQRFWKMKTTLLAVALVSVWALMALCLVESALRPGHSDLMAWVRYSAVMTLVVFSGGLWSTLLLRDVVSAFLCTCLAPLSICAVTMAAAGRWVNPETNSDQLSFILCGTLLLYAGASFMWAQRLFLRAQDVAWTGGQLSLKAGRGRSFRWLAFEFKGRKNRWMAAVQKELQLQEITMVLIPLLALMFVLSLVAYRFIPESSSIRKIFLDAVPFTWLMSVPFVIGCVAVAEERRLNTLEGLLCLPMSKRASFAVKLGVTLVLGIVLGGVLPGLLVKDLELLTAVRVAAGITALAFYASTLSRGMLQAVPVALCIPVAMGLAVGLAVELTADMVGNYQFLHNSFYSTLGWPATTLTAMWLAFKNYQHLQTGWRVWIGNAIRAAAVFVVVTLVSIAIFDRFWELFLRLEPAHGAARITGNGSAFIIAPPPIAVPPPWTINSGVYILLPDGRIWIGVVKHEGTPVVGPDDLSPTSVSGKFIPGSNWVTMAGNEGGVAAIQSDGGLWRISDEADVSRIGSESDWKKVVGTFGVFLGLKQDGTLWGWNHNLSKGTGTHKGFISDPVLIGKDSDWLNIFRLNDRALAGMKRDGRLSIWSQFRSGPTRIPNDLDRFGLKQSNPPSFEGTNWSSLANVNGVNLGIYNDGTLRFLNYVPKNMKVADEYVRPNAGSGVGLIGENSDWIELNASEGQFIALEANGSLWTWLLDLGQTKHPSHYSDWVAATLESGNTWALAKDGTLSCWNSFGDTYFNSRIFDHTLGPTRRPILTTNIFAAVK